MSSARCSRRPCWPSARRWPHSSSSPAVAASPIWPSCSWPSRRRIRGRPAAGSSARSARGRRSSARSACSRRPGGCAPASDAARTPGPAGAACWRSPLPRLLRGLAVAALHLRSDLHRPTRCFSPATGTCRPPPGGCWSRSSASSSCSRSTPACASCDASIRFTKWRWRAFCSGWASASSPSCRSGWPLLVTVAALALAQALFVPLSTAIVSHLASAELRGRYMGVWTLVWTAGASALGPAARRPHAGTLGPRGSCDLVIALGSAGAGLYAVLRAKAG